MLEKSYRQSYQGLRGGLREAFSDKVTQGVDIFTNEPVVQCDV